MQNISSTYFLGHFKKPPVSRNSYVLHNSCTAISYYVTDVLCDNYLLRIILVRTLRRDIAQYNKEDEEIDETLEETGWKLVHGDIFRPPTKSTILCALVGSGIQIGMMGLITIIVAMFGMLSPSARGSLITGNTTSYVPSY